MEESQQYPVPLQTTEDGANSLLNCVMAEYYSRDMAIGDRLVQAANDIGAEYRRHVEALREIQEKSLQDIERIFTVSVYKQ